MKTLEILKTKKEEIVEKTISILHTAIGGNRGMFVASLAFYLKIDEETGEIDVDYYPFAGNQYHSENVFWIIPSHEIPDCDSLGIESLDDISDVDWYILGYDSFIEETINRKIEDIEMYNYISH